MTRQISNYQSFASGQRKSTIWVLVLMTPVAALTASAAAWSWQLPVLYVVLAALLQLLVRLSNPHVELFVHTALLCGGAPFMIRVFGETDLSPLAAVHIAAVLGISAAIGYALADQIRASPQGVAAG